MKEGLSIRAYARLKGVSHVTILRHIRDGAIRRAVLPDGKIDAEIADREIRGAVSKGPLARRDV